jgi:hypothetical protein
MRIQSPEPGKLALGAQDWNFISSLAMSQADYRAIMNFLRRYGWYVFLVPSAIFLPDDFATNWHGHGHDRLSSSNPEA